MSSNLLPLHVVKVLDPRVKINNERVFTALKGAQVNSWQQFQASNVSNNSAQVTCNPPSQDIIVSRLVFKKYVFSGTITGTNSSGGPLLLPGYYGPRAYPIASILASEQMTINNDTLTQAQLQTYWPALMWYSNEYKNRFGQFSLTAAMLDQFQTYTQGAGTSRNPLGAYGDNSFEIARGGFYGLVLSGNTNASTSVTYTLTVIEPVLISPFVFGDGSNSTPGLIGVQNMSYTATFAGLDTARVLSLQANQGTNGSIALTGQTASVDSVTLMFEYITPSQLEPIPRNLVSSYYEIVNYQSPAGPSTAPAASFSAIMSSVQVNSIPQRMFIWCGRGESAKTAYTADSYFSLPTTGNPLQVTWNNQQFFSSSTPSDLYNMCYSNGINMSATQFFNRVGSVICIDFGKDLGLFADEAPSLNGNYQLSLTCNFVNTNPTDTIVPTLNVAVVYGGQFNIFNGQASHNIGGLTKNDVINAQEDPAVQYKENTDVYGGSFFSSLKRGVGNVLKYVKKHQLGSKILSQIPHPFAQQGATALRSLGYGVSGGGVSGGGYSGGAVKKYKSKAKKPAAKPTKKGKLSVKEMKKRLRGAGLKEESENEQEQMQSGSGSESESEQENEVIYDMTPQPHILYQQMYQNGYDRRY